jgi:divalent metal cation (Fe/Co/Zn/Cd) transporter
MRWIGHSLRAEAEVTVDPALTIVAAHQIAVEAEHALLHAIPRLAAVTVHPDPSTAAGGTHHARSHHHGRQK